MNHEFNWDGVKILEEHNLSKRLVSEMLYIKCQKKWIKFTSRHGTVATHTHVNIIENLLNI